MATENLLMSSPGEDHRWVGQLICIKIFPPEHRTGVCMIPLEAGRQVGRMRDLGESRPLVYISSKLCPILRAGDIPSASGQTDVKHTVSNWVQKYIF